jgi:prohibitin 1
VNISLRVLSRPQPEKLAWIYKEIGPDYDDKVLPSLGNEILKSVVAQYNAEELLSERARISQEIRSAIIKRAANFELVLDDVSITHLTFGKEFARAIESKQVAQQEAERQHWIVAKADQEQKAVVIRAEGEAEAAALISQAINSAGTGLIEVRRIDAARDIAAVLTKAPNVTFLPSGGAGDGEKGGSNLLLNVGK